MQKKSFWMKFKNQNFKFKKFWSNKFSQLLTWPRVSSPFQGETEIALIVDCFKIDEQLSTECLNLKKCICAQI